MYQESLLVNIKYALSKGSFVHYMALEEDFVIVGESTYREDYFIAESENGLRYIKLNINRIINGDEQLFINGDHVLDIL